MSWDNHDDVLQQLQAAGLELERGLEVDRLVRCKTPNDRGRQKTGWYTLHDMPLNDGRRLLVGAYGDWREGADPATGKPVSHRIQLSRSTPLSDDQKAALRARIAEDRKRAAARRKAEAARAARVASAAWKKCGPTWCPTPDDAPLDTNDYLTRKCVQAHGARFSPSGNLVVPILDGVGRLHGLQIIYDDPKVKKRKGRDKDFWPAGLAMRGHWFQIGTPGDLILVTEGLATGASLNEATGLPVSIAFYAGNLMPVAEALHKRYPRARLLICADDDFKTEGNPGVSAASSAALAVGGAWLAPVFEDRGEAKLTDWNDLHVEEGLHAVRAQLEGKLAELGWGRGASATAGAKPAGGEGSDDARLRPIESEDELHERFALVYGHGSTVFDFKERMLLSLSDMRDACTQREMHRRWAESPRKKMVRVREVGFDPAGQDPEILCNLWGGWPTTPRAGSCEVLLDLLEFLCAEEDKPQEVFDWVLKWIAYPIQHPGAKMKTALVLHGPQGAGKNMFFEAVMAIYGEYGRIVDQSTVEDKFNDWVSKKLFLIADEVVARQELYHTKNKLKGVITGDTIRINPKHVSPYDERNHANLVFLSNETQPLVLERDDRRYTVIWTPKELEPRFYVDVKAEIAAGGIAALHHHLLHLDLGDFQTWTRPPMTRSKHDLIDLGLDSTERFWRAWVGDEIGVPVSPVKSEDLYDLYRLWCTRAGIPRYAPQHVLLANIRKREKVTKRQARYFNGAGERMATFIFPPGTDDPPPGKGQSLWLTDHVDTFRTALDTWKQSREAAQ